MTDLAACFGRSRLRQDAQMCYDSSEPYANVDDDAGWTLDPIPSTEGATLERSRSRIMAPQSQGRRSQRHSNTRLLCSAAHRKDIAALVARMVESKEQCSVAPAEIFPSTLVAAGSADDDEGYDSSSEHYEASEESRQSSSAASRVRLRYRRSTDFKANSACVKKSVRLRKDKKCRPDA